MGEESQARACARDDRYDRATGADAHTIARERLRGLALAFAGVLAYVCIHAGFRMLASSTLGEDDTLDQILAQELHAGYFPRQPPLYDWVLYGVQQLTGPQLISFLFIKYAALTATVVFLYLSAYRILKDRIWALVTVESLALIYQIAWRYHEGFTHEVLAMVAVTATLWALLRLYDHGRARDYVVFGVISGLGMLTEPNYTVYQMCLWTAVAMQPALRRALVKPMLVVAAGLAVAIASPFIVWVVSDPAHLNYFFLPSTRGHLHDALIGVKDGVRGPFMYLAPLIVIVPAVFPGYLARAWADVRDVFARACQDGPADLQRLVLTTMLAGIGLSILGGLVFGIGNYAMHVLMPLYVTSVIWIMSVAQRSVRAGQRRPVLVRVALGIAVLALVVRLANMFIHDPVCGKCRWGIPYATLAQSLRADGFDDAGTITVADDEIGGNLRPYFPQARFVLVGPRSFTPQRPEVAGAAQAFVWGAAVPLSTVERNFAGYPKAVQALAQAKVLKAPWTHIWKQDGYRTSDWAYVILK